MRKPDSDIDRGWAWLVLIAVYLGIIILSTTMFMGGVLYVALLEHYNADEAKTSLVGALNGGLLCLLGPLASVVMTTFSCRICMFVGGLLSAVSCLTSAFIGNVDILILTYGIIGGIGNCLTSTPFVVVLGYYFHTHRNIVIAISQAVIGVGFFLASPLALIILNRFGLQGTFLILGGINAHLCVVAAICKPSSVEQRILDTKSQHLMSRRQKKADGIEEDVLFLKHDEVNGKLSASVQIQECETFCIEPLENTESKMFSKETLAVSSSRKEYVGHEQRKFDETECKDLLVCDKFNDSGISSDTETEPVVVFELQERSNSVHIETSLVKSRKHGGQDLEARRGCLHLIKDIRLVMFLFSTMSWNFTLSMCIMHLPNYMAVRGAGDVDISAIMTCFSASNLAGRFIAAVTVDKGGIDSLTLHVGMLGVAGLVTLTFPIYSGAVGDYIFTAAIGLYTGGPNSLMTPITLKMVNIEDLSAAHGLEYFFSGLGYVPGPFVAGLLYSLNGSYELSFVCGGCILLLGCIFAMVSAVKTLVSVPDDVTRVT